MLITKATKDEYEHAKEFGEKVRFNVIAAPTIHGFLHAAVIYFKNEIDQHAQVPAWNVFFGREEK